MSKMLKTVLAFVLAAATLIPSTSAFANPQEAPAFSQNSGSLTITRIAGDVERAVCVREPEDPLCDALVPVTPVAPGYAIAGVPIRIRQITFPNGMVPTQEQLNNPQWIEDNATFVGAWIYQVTGANGEAVFNNLPLGHYLVQELEEAEINGTTVINPTPRYLEDAITRNHFNDFVVAIPRWVGPTCTYEPDADEDCTDYDSGWLYDVRAYPKSGLPEYEDGTKTAIYYSGDVATWELSHQIPNAVRSIPHFSATDTLPTGLTFITGSVVGRFTASDDINNGDAITDWNLVTGQLLATHFDVTHNPANGVLHIAINEAGRAFLADYAHLGEGEVMFRFETRITEAGTHRNNARWDIGTPPWNCPIDDPDCPLPICPPGSDYYPTCIPPCPVDDPTCNTTYDELSTFELHILKLNIAEQELQGAYFRVYRELTSAELAAETLPAGVVLTTDGTQVVPLTNATGSIIYGSTNANGVLIFTPISSDGDQVNLWIRETQAPAGYQVLQEWIQVNVDSAHRRPGGVDSNVDFYYIVDVTVFNDVEGGWQLPETGGMGTIILTVAGITLVGGSLALFLTGKKEEQDAA